MSDNCVRAIVNVYNNLCDEESKDVFRAKMELIINKNEGEFLEWFLSKKQNIYIPELDEFEKMLQSSQRQYILFGAGVEGKKAYKIMNASHRKVYAWCDNNRDLWGKEIDGLKVLSPKELIKSFKDFFVIITAKSYMLSIYQQLLMMDFPRANIIIPQNGFLLGFSGQQYFDVFSPQNDEVFIDAGCWDGATTKEFVQWSRGKYEHIYAFEPDLTCWSRCESTFEENNIHRVSFIKEGLWKKKGILYFTGVGRGSSQIHEQKVSENQVDVTSIDEVLCGKKVTFIKMDVEGSEMEALMGGKESIQKYKPKLAICVYHKSEDLWKLAEYVLELNKDYKLYMRHYSTCNYETVLYAV